MPGNNFTLPAGQICPAVGIAAHHELDLAGSSLASQFLSVSIRAHPWFN
jgi:hypothetical protein